MKVVLDVSRMHAFNFDRGVGVYTDNLHKSLKKHFPQYKFVVGKEKSNLSGADIIHYPYFDLF